MRVLFVTEGFKEEFLIAQPWRYTYEIASQLVKQRHEVAIATDSPYTDTRKEAVIRDLSAYILPRIRLLPSLSSRIDPCQLGSLVKEFSPDVIYWDGGALTGNYIRRLKDIDVPIAVHISTNLYSFRDSARALIQEFEPTEYPFLTYLVTMSSPLARPLVCLLNRKNISLITVPNLAIKRKLTENGLLESKIKVISTPFCREEVLPDQNVQDPDRTREKTGLGIEDFIVTYFGPSDTYRGTNTLLHAIAKLGRKLPKLKLLMLLRQGYERHDRSLMKQISKLMLEEKVKLVGGRLEREDLIRFLQASDAIALPFKYLKNEPSIAVLETMALGKPLITTRVSGLPELIGNDRGLLAEPGSANDLARKIYYLAKSPVEAEALGRRARAYVSSLPDWSKIVKHILVLFEQVLKHS
jgi:glycosyltransferase involved in cell wall biosynthesis